MSGSVEQYKKEYCQMLIDHMAKGYSLGSFGAVINHGRTTLYDWMERHPEFKEAYNIGHSKALMVFETVLMAKSRGVEVQGIELKKTDTACLIFALKTRFKEHYTEKTEVDHTSSDGSMSFNFVKKDK